MTGFTLVREQDGSIEGLLTIFEDRLKDKDTTDNEVEKLFEEIAYETDIDPEEFYSFFSELVELARKHRPHIQIKMTGGGD